MAYCKVDVLKFILWAMTFNNAHGIHSDSTGYYGNDNYVF